MQKQLRFTLHFVTALISKYYLALILGLVMGISSLILSPRLVRLIPPLRSIQTIAVVGRYTQSDIPLSIQQKISSGLTSINDQGLPVPALAATWSASPDGKTYTFDLDPRRPRWQDGTPIKSQDINYQFRDTQTLYPSSSQISITLKDPFAALPIVVSRPIFKKGLLGNGTYRVKQIHKNGSLIDILTLAPVDKNSRLPYLQYHFYASESQARIAYKLGVVRTIDDILDPADLSSWPNSQIITQIHPDRYVAVFFNTSDPFLTGTAGRNLRLGLTYAIAKDRWAVSRAYGPINPNSWANNPDVKMFDQDINKAKQLLKTVDKLPDPITLSVLPAYLSVAELIKTDWEQIGLHVNISVTPEIPNDFQALIIAQAIPADPDQYNLWHSTQATNLTKFHNPRIDKLLEDGRKTLDQNQRLNLYLDFQKYLVEEVPAAFLYHPSTTTLTRK